MMDLDEPDDVYWSEDVSPNVVRGAHKKSCETIAEAVKFVMGRRCPSCSERLPIWPPRISTSASRKSGRSTRVQNTGPSRPRLGYPSSLAGLAAARCTVANPLPILRFPRRASREQARRPPRKDPRTSCRISFYGVYTRFVAAQQIAIYEPPFVFEEGLAKSW